jgi:membrane protease YdiL (CAAX protease family)
MDHDEMSPMPFWETFLIFAYTLISGFVMFYWFRPCLEAQGFSEMRAYLFAANSVLVSMFVWALVAFRIETGSFEWRRLVKRFRLGKLTWKMVLWAIVLSVIMFGGEAVFLPLLSRMVENGIINIPDSLPVYLNPTMHTSLSEMKTQFAREGIFPWIPLVLFFNIFGEELLWRGYLLPRQELTGGQHTWVLHGLLWGLSHTFQYWLLPPIFLGAMVLSFVVQKMKNTWIGIIAHAINNSLPFLILLLLIE